jgi:hypothetical protein
MLRLLVTKYPVNFLVGLIKIANNFSQGIRLSDKHSKPRALRLFHPSWYWAPR